MHQCFICGELGSSAMPQDTQVFCYFSANCGRYYRPYCVSQILYQSDFHGAMQFCFTTAAGETFVCPIHCCRRCEGAENSFDSVLQFAICRQCPAAYHRKCLPREHDIEAELQPSKRHQLSFPYAQSEGTNEGCSTSVLLTEVTNSFVSLVKKRKKPMLLGLSPVRKQLTSRVVPPPPAIVAHHPLGSYPTHLPKVTESTQ